MSEHLLWNTKELQTHRQASQLIPLSEVLHSLQIKPALGLKFHKETEKKQTKTPT